MSQPFVGQILAVGFNFPPRGWSIANGATLSIAQNTALFSLLGTYYGGNGTTTFQLPNLQGRVAIGQGQSPGTANYVIGELAGTETVVLLQNNMPVHTHTISPATAATTVNALTAPSAKLQTPSGNLLTGASDAVSGNAVNAYAAPGTGTAASLASGAATTTLSGSVGTAGGSVPFQILQPFLVINYVIALVGIFPSRN